MLTVVPLVSEAIPRVSGGGLTHNYIFSEAQFHWGDLTAGGPLPLRSKYLPSYNKFSFTGSEHTRSKVSFAMEIQFVHYKESLGSLSKAMLSDDWDSLAIISVFCYVIRISLLIRNYPGHVQLQNRIQALAPYMDVISSALGNISQPGLETEIPSFPLANLLPENQERFFRYNGSLTSPPCTENVVVRQAWALDQLSYLS